MNRPLYVSRLRCFALAASLIGFLCAAPLGRAQGTFSLTVTAPAAVVQNQQAIFTVVASEPVGVPVPTGTVTLNDETANTQYPMTLTAGSATISIPSLTPAGNHSYSVAYANGNYPAYTIYGQIFVEAGLVAVAPAVAVAGAPATTATLTGQGFTNASVAQLAPPNANAVPLITTYVSPTKLQAVIPASMLTAAALNTLSVVTGASLTNTVPFTVYTPFSDVVSVQGAPAAITYGQTGPFTLTVDVVRGAATDAAVPTGAVTFSLDGTAVPGSGQLSALTANGSYQTGTPVAIDSNPGKLVSADFNEDGLADVLGLNANAGSFLQLFLSSGPDSFQTESEVFSGCQPQDFAVADINKDGSPDIVVACANPTAPGPYAMYVLGNGDGTFQAPVAIANSTITAPTQIGVGDFNGDGNLDVVLIDAAGDIQVFNGSAPFTGFTAQPATTFPVTGGTPVNAIAADFNQDGLSDLAVLEYAYNFNGVSGSGAVLVLTNNGNGTFTGQQQPFTSSASNLQSMTVTDVNGDGFPDIAVADPGEFDTNDSGQVLIYENNGAGQLNAAFPYPAAGATSVTGAPFPVIGKGATASQPAWSLVYSAVNPPSDAISLTALERQSATSYSVAYTNAVGYAPFTDGGAEALPITAGDWNGDGSLDLILNADATAGNSAAQLIPAFFGNDASATLASTLPLLNPGVHNLTAAYPGDLNFAAGTSAALPITVNQATPVPGLTGPPTATFGQAVVFTATVVGVAGAAPPTGTVQLHYGQGNTLGPAQALIPGTGSSTAQISTAALPVGTNAVYAAYSGDGNYLEADSGNLPVVVSAASLSLVSINPASGYLGSAATPITLTGTGFTTSSIAQLNGAAIATTYVSGTQLQAIIPASFFHTVQNGTVTVTNLGNTAPSAGVAFSVTLPPVQVVLSGPATAPSATQPTINFQLPTAYPIDITGTFTLTIQPTTTGGLVDPAVQFAGGGDTLTFTLPANTTVTPTVQLQTGTLSCSITVTLTLTAAGVDITPASLQPVVLQVPPAAPTISSLAVARNGTNFTVTIQGFSNTRDMKNAVFNFTGASGATLNNPMITVDLSSAFLTWYGQTTSDQYGSEFTYVQVFVLTDDASSIGSVSATLINSVGPSNSKSGQ